MSAIESKATPANVRYSMTRKPIPLENPSASSASQDVAKGTTNTPDKDDRDLQNQRALTEQAFLERCLELGYIPLQFMRWHPELIETTLSRGMPRHLRILKRTTDIVGSVLLGALTLPLIPFILLLIKLDSPGPVFYSHMRLGQGGRLFRIYKFRSMYTDAEAEGVQFTVHNDDRITRFGNIMRRTRIDEVPQLWNVLMGDMSFVGPRPERPEHLEAIEREIPEFSMRLAVKPGLTGWAQASYRYAGTLEELRRKLEYDLYYIRFASVRLDLLILLRTIRVVFGLKGR